MRALTSLGAVRRISTFLAAAVLGLAATACAGDDPMTGSWAQSDATTPLPMTLGGGDLAIDATMEMNGRVSPATFDLDMDLEALGLTDNMRLEGTYVDEGSDLTLTITGFVIDPASDNTARVRDDGSHCIVLSGFAGTEVCFRSPQTNPYTVGDQTLTIVLDHEIAGAPESQTTLALTPSEEPSP